MEKLSAHNFTLNSSSQMALPELTLATRASSVRNSFGTAFTIHRNRQISYMGDNSCLLYVFVDTFVCVSGCRRLYLCGDGGVMVCVCVCARVLCVCVCVCACACDACGKPMCTITFTCHVLLDIRTEYRHCNHCHRHRHHHHTVQVAICASGTGTRKMTTSASYRG